MTVAHAAITASAAQPEASCPDRGRYALWGAQIALAALFVFAGSMKFIMSADEMTKNIDLPISFLRFIGVAEVLGGFGLILPGMLRIRRGLTPLAATGLVIIMIGATIITTVEMSALAALWPFGVGAAAAIIAWQRRAWFAA